jgi:membrane protein YdbS with pleckstrin-like domain
MLPPDLSRLPPAALTLFRIAAIPRLLMHLFMVAPLVIIARTGDKPVLYVVAAAFALAALAFALLYPPRAFARYGYALREHDLLIVSGVLVHDIVSIPAGRIQHVDVHQGPFERHLGLASIQVYTASGGRADGEIQGLLKETADALREQLVAREATDDVV